MRSLRRATTTARRRLRLPGVHPALPRPGWVEHDAAEIWTAVQATLAELAAPARRADRRHRHHQPARDGGRGIAAPAPLPTAPSSGRTAAPPPAATSCARPATERASATTGLVLDPYFSATKVEWLLTEGGVRADARHCARHRRHLAAVEPDRRPDGGVHATEPSNASRTLLFDIGDLAWSDELLELFGVPRCRPAGGAALGRALRRHRRGLRVPAGIPVSGSPATSRRRCSGRRACEPGMTKNTYGTGSFVLMNVGDDVPRPGGGLLTTVAWTMEPTAPPPTRWRARSSSPAPPSSGCATGSA